VQRNLVFKDVSGQVTGFISCVKMSKKYAFLFDILTLKMRAIHERSVANKPSLLNKQEERTSQLCHSKSLKSRTAYSSEMLVCS